MNTTTNAFIYGATQSIGDTAIAYALTAARWGVLGWEWYCGAFFSPAANRRYRLVGEIIGHCIILAVIGWRMAQQWADGEVSAALPVDHFPCVGNMVDPFCPTVNPLPVAPVVEDVGKALEVTCLETCSIRHLKAMARGHVPNYGRMTKAQLVAALQGVAS